MAELRFQRATESLGFGPQPTVEELALVSKEFRAVLNLRARREAGYIDEQDTLVKQGVDYYNIEWELPTDLTDALAAEIFEKIDSMPKPLFVHCAVGYTAAFAVIVSVCKANKLPLQTALQLGMDVGFDFTRFAPMYSVAQKELS